MAAFKKAADIRVGVVGYGGAFNMGAHHLREMKAAGMTPAAVVDTDPVRAAQAEQDFPGIPAFTSVSEMLKTSDANLITLITPHNTHAALALECLKAGRHVVCEKPFAITTEECDAMIAEARKAGLLLSTYHNRHWDGRILRAVEQVVREGVIGRVFRIEAHMGGYHEPGSWWRTSKSISGGILYDWGVHLLEYGLQIIDSEIAEVSGFAKTGFWAPQSPWKEDTNEDEGFVAVRFTSGQWLTLTITSIDSNPKRGWLEITGEKGSYIFDGEWWETVQHAGGVATTRRGKNPKDEGWRLYRNVAAALTGDEPLVITAEWARRPIHILDLAGQSAKQGRSLPARYG